MPLTHVPLEGGELKYTTEIFVPDTSPTDAHRLWLTEVWVKGGGVFLHTTTLQFANYCTYIYLYFDWVLHRLDSRLEPNPMHLCVQVFLVGYLLCRLETTSVKEVQV